MKLLTLIVHADVQGALADALRTIPQVSDFFFMPVEGHGAQEHSDENLSARDRVVGYVPNIRASVLLEDAAVPAVLTALRASDCGIRDRGVFWVSPVDGYGRL